MIIKKNFVTILLLFLLPMIARTEFARRSSYPYISGDTFRAFCDHIIDETEVAFDPEKVKDGDTIFLKPDYINKFFTTYYSKIEAKLIIVSHNSAHSVPGNFVRYLDNDNILAWFTKNTNRIHPKLFVIPVGLANSHFSYGKTSCIEEAKKIVPLEKDQLLYMNFTLKTNPKKRKPVYDLFSKAPYCFKSGLKKFPQYLKDVARSKFVLSPQGTGIDCYRVWEALYMGSIPIILHSSIDALYQDLPVLIINDWKEISPEFLSQHYQVFSGKTYAYEKLYADYWFDKIKSIQNEYRNS